MKKIFTLITLSVVIVLSTLSCEKDIVDPALPPIIEATASDEADSKAFYLRTQSSAEYLFDLQTADIWKACQESKDPEIVYAYFVQARLILDTKQKKVDKKLRRVITVFAEPTVIIAETNFLASIYNDKNIRYYKTNTGFSRKSPSCPTLSHFFSSAEALGGVWVK